MEKLIAASDSRIHLACHNRAKVLGKADMFDDRVDHGGSINIRPLPPFTAGKARLCLIQIERFRGVAADTAGFFYRFSRCTGKPTELACRF